ncbi:hypothetical protein [Beijerinckia sp. L45]|uniref:hypothetical protein n=1 Tax=Beijerinckia sp. L45 TaxID=1641855 RepID=UPI00131B77D8|nr:hypothetical protein [Beijerinckia sp. L45]
MIDPHELIGVARLLNADRGPQPPSSEAIRRAVSTAYYALFHAMLKEAAERFVGASDSSVAYEVIYRGFEHGQMSRVFKDLEKTTLSEANKKRLRRSEVTREIRDFAAVFVSMQQWRYLADYSPRFSILQKEAADLIDEAEAALHTLAKADADEKADLLAIMLVKAR